MLDLAFVPVTASAGYMMEMGAGFGARAALSGGVLFSRTSHHETVIHLLTGVMRDSAATSPFAGAKVFLTYNIPGGFLQLYLGGGLEAVFEREGIIPLPLAEGGITLRPFALARVILRAPRRPAPAPVETAPESGPAPGLPAPPESPEPENAAPALSAVYFRSGSAEVLEHSLSALDAAGEYLRDHPASRAVLRAYTAPFGEAEGRLAVSRARARFCRAYLEENFGIARDRAAVEIYGAGKTPEHFEGREWAGWEPYRCVEIIILPDVPQADGPPNPPGAGTDME